MKNCIGSLVLILTFPFHNLSTQEFTQKKTWEVGGRANYTNTTTVSNDETSENSLSNLSLDVPIYYFVSMGYHWVLFRD